MAATADGDGVTVGPTRTSDPYGQPLAGLPDNRAGNHDVGWLGGVGTEHAAGSPQLIEMGARVYSPLLGRFLEVEPVPGGSANDYDYAFADPVNGTDRSGNYAVLGVYDRDPVRSTIGASYDKNRVSLPPSPSVVAAAHRDHAAAVAAYLDWIRVQQWRAVRVLVNTARDHALRSRSDSGVTGFWSSARSTGGISASASANEETLIPHYNTDNRLCDLVGVGGDPWGSIRNGAAAAALDAARGSRPVTPSGLAITGVVTAGCSVHQFDPSTDSTLDQPWFDGAGIPMNYYVS